MQEKKITQKPREQKHKLELDWIEICRTRSGRHDKTPVKKFRHWYEAKSKTRRGTPKDVLRTCHKDCPKTAQFSYMTWREWIDFYAWINSCQFFFSNKVEVAWRFICHVKYWSVTEIVSCILLKSNQMIFLVQFGINKHSYIFQRTQIFVILEKFTCTYLFQIALDIIFAPKLRSKLSPICKPTAV